MTERAGAPWLLYILATLCVAAVVTAFLVVGPPAQSAASRRTAVVGRGVVQSTVSASGTLTAVGQANASFRVSGALAAVYVHVGEHVLAGRLLAELNPDAAQRSLAVAEDNLRAAQDRLDEAGSESSSAGSESAIPTTGKSTSTKPTSTKPTSTSTSTQPTQSPAAKAANVAGDEASVESARATVVSAEEALADTKLYAPADGTVASIAQETPGNSVSAGSGGSSGGGSSGGSAAGSSGSSSSAGSSGAGGASAQGGGSSAGSSSGSGSSSSSSGFVVLVDTSSMEVVVPMSESDITKIKVGQPATVTVNALPEEKLAARVVSSALLSTTNSGVVSYDVTLKLEQEESDLRPGMTAGAQIVVAQAENAVNVTSSAISGRGGTQTVTVMRDGKEVRQPIITGLVGDSTTQVLSGLGPGEQVVITLATGASLGSGTTGAGRTGFGTGGFGGGGGLGGGGGVRFFGGGGAG